MAWEIKYHPLAKEELARLDGSVRKIVLKGIFLRDMLDMLFRIFLNGLKFHFKPKALKGYLNRYIQFSNVPENF